MLDGREVVTVRYDPARLPFERLLATAVDRDCATAGVWVADDGRLAAARDAVGERARELTTAARPDAEPKYRLLHTPFRALPLTALQATRVNARIAGGRDFDDLLSPRQRALAARIRARPDADWPNLIGVDLEEAVRRFDAFATGLEARPKATGGTEAGR